MTTEVNQGSAECTVCGNVSEGITPEERKNKAEEIVKLQALNDDIELELQKIGFPNQEILRLSKYRDSSGHQILVDLEYELSTKAFSKKDEEKIRK